MLGMNSVLQGVTVTLSNVVIYLKINHCAVYLLPYLLEFKMGFFPLNLALKCVRSSWIHVWNTELDHATPDCFEPDHVESNQDLQHQIVTWYLHSVDILRSIEW